MATKDTIESRDGSLYNNNTLSDITIKFNDRQVFAHKVILAQKSAYFMTAFTSLLPVRLQIGVIENKTDDLDRSRLARKLILETMTTPKLFHAMIRHIYDLPCAKQVTDTTGSEENLVFCLNVRIVADKYDVVRLGQTVVPDFCVLLQRTWKSQGFVGCVNKLCGPDAIYLADSSLQTAIADSFVDMSKITHHKSLVTTIQEDKSFTGRILASLLKPTSGSTRYLGVCHKPNRSNRTSADCTGVHEGDGSYLAAMNLHCPHCGTAAGTVYNKTGGGMAESQFRNAVKVVLM
ncbi:hypothetical protein KCU95_g5252, partial [Aureobasidium melanogenum]